MNSTKREELLQGMNDQHVDVIIIGGGITGSGLAFDAVKRGMTTALFEMQDFGAGTSSRSTKLVHGGLRYLKQFEVKMVAEVGKERAIVYENGPHVTTPEWMMLPFYKGGTFGPFMTSMGLRVYDFLAGVKKGERRTMFDVKTTIEKEPLVKRDGLIGSGYYVEYRTDDARMTIEVLKEAVAHGAKAVNYTKVDSFIYEGEKAVGVHVKDLVTGNTYKVYGKKIINATGPWVDELREKDNSKKGKHLQLSKGIHIVIDGKRFPLKQAVYFDTPDGRMVFAIPRDGKAYVGTTDTFYESDKVNPTITEEDRRYLIDSIDYIFPDVGITEEDIESSWSGIRPLIYEEGKGASEISRKDEIWVSPSGLITIAGGKLTGYRHMAEMVMDLVGEQIKKEYNILFDSCQTIHAPISGGHVGGSENYDNFVQEKTRLGVHLGLTEEESYFLASHYGSNVEKVYQYLTEEIEGLPKVIAARLLYAIHEEMTVTPIDFFMRRTGAALFDIDWVYKWKEKIIDAMANECGWTEAKKQQYTEELEQFIHYCTTPIKEEQFN